MADLLDEFDNPEIPTDRKGFFDSLFSGLDKPSNALQGLFIEGLEGAQKGWNQERNYDYEELYTDEFRKNNPNFSYYSSGALNFLVDPLNVVGLGLFNKADKVGKLVSPVGGANAANQSKGMFTTINPNYITGYYGPTEKAIAKANKSMERMGLGRNNPNYSVAEWEALRNMQPAMVMDKPAEIGKWAINGMLRSAQMMLPKNRAIYRQTGINAPMMKAASVAGKSSPTIEPLHRLIANQHIAFQAGRNDIPQKLKDITSSSFHSDYTKYIPGAYSKTATPFMDTDAVKVISQKDLNDFEKHLNEWKDGKGKGFFDADNSHIIIKKKQGPYSGMHYNDWHKTKFMGDIAWELGKGKVPKDADNFLSYLKKNVKDFPANAKVSPDGDGIIFSYSKPGSSITEGGVNFWTKLKPNGDMVGIMSDEHNLFEKVLSKVPGGDKALPRRLVAATPPMYGNLFDLKRRQLFGDYMAPARKGQRELELSLKQDPIVGIAELVKDSIKNDAINKQILNYERARLGSKGLGASLLLAPDND